MVVDFDTRVIIFFFVSSAIPDLEKYEKVFYVTYISRQINFISFHKSYFYSKWKCKKKKKK